MHSSVISIGDIVIIIAMRHRNSFEVGKSVAAADCVSILASELLEVEQKSVGE